jgi:hypothetical protein
VKKQGGEIDLESVGDYFNVLAGNSSLLGEAQNSSLSSEQLSLLQKYFGNEKSEKSLVDADGKIIEAGNAGQSAALY